MSYSSAVAPAAATVVKHRREHPPYVFQAYPSVRFHPDGSERTVQNIGEDQALGQPWRDKPFPAAAAAKQTAAAHAHTAVHAIGTSAAKPDPAIATLTTELAELKAANVELQAAHDALTKENADLVAYCAEQNTQLAEFRKPKAPKPVKPAKAE